MQINAEYNKLIWYFRFWFNTTLSVATPRGEDDQIYLAFEKKSSI